MPSVGHHLKIEVIEADRRAQLVAEPLSGLVGGAEARLPHRGLIVVQGGHGVGPQGVGETPERVRHRARVVRPRSTDRLVDHVVGDQWGDPGLSGQRERAGRR